MTVTLTDNIEYSLRDVISDILSRHSCIKKEKMTPLMTSLMTPEKQDETLEFSKHWSPDSTLARNEVIMKMTYPVNQ